MKIRSSRITASYPAHNGRVALVANRNPSFYPSAIVVDLSRIIWMFTPATSPLKYLFVNDLYTNGEALKFFLARNPIQIIITALLSCSRDPENPSPSFWEAMECIFQDGYDGLEETPSGMDALDLLGMLLMEEIDKELETVFNRIGLPKEDQFDFYYSQWLSKTSVVLTPLISLCADLTEEPSEEDGTPLPIREETWL